MASITFDLTRGGVRLKLNVDETSARCGKEKCPIKYKIAIMLLHIHKFSTEGIPQHAVYPALPSREQGGRGITAAVGGENSGFIQDGKLNFKKK